MHEYLNFDSKGAPLPEPETPQEAQWRKANDPQTDLCACACACACAHAGERSG